MSISLAVGVVRSDVVAERGGEPGGWWGTGRGQVSRIEYLRDPSLPENQPEPGVPTLAERFRRAVGKMDRLYALCASSGEINDLREDIKFFQAVRVYMAKFDVEDRRSRGLPILAEIALYLRQLTAGMIEAGEVTDIYAAAGLEKPDLSHLDEAYLERLRASKTPNLAIEALRRAIEEAMRRTTRHKVVRREAFSARLIELMNRYTNQHLTAAEILGELVTSVRRSITVDWTSRDDVRAKLRSTIKRLLAVHGYPPDAAEEAIKLVLRQTETLAEEWSTESLR